MAYGPCVMFLGRPGIGKYLGCDKNMRSFSKANISPSLAEAGKFSGEGSWSRSGEGLATSAIAGPAELTGLGPPVGSREF